MFFQNIPTNLIIGFLGVGKTTAIRQLLAQVPEGQRWAVLVNEFGEVGVDGAFLREEDVAVEEVAGGCMCCVTGAGLQVGLNRLIRQYKPDRILIEPTGLGHPAQIIETLTTPPFAQVLNVQATIGLIDARQLADTRYTEHPTYQDQLFLADVLVANKADLYTTEDEDRYTKLVREFTPEKLRYAMTTQGHIQSEWLQLPRNEDRKALFPEAHAFIQAQETAQGHEVKPAVTKWSRIEQMADDYYSCGWIMPRETTFSQECLVQLFEAIPARRIKGILNSEQGWIAFNLAGGERDIQSVTGQKDNRLELIHDAPMEWTEIDQKLRNCQLH